MSEKVVAKRQNVTSTILCRKSLGDIAGCAAAKSEEAAVARSQPRRRRRYVAVLSLTMGDCRRGKSQKAILLGF